MNAPTSPATAAALTRAVKRIKSYASCDAAGMKIILAEELSRPAPKPRRTRLILSKEDFAVHYAGQRHGRALLVQELLERYARDKLAFLKEEMFQKAATVKGDAEWAAYAEGVRQALNVLESCDDPNEAYAGIINLKFDTRTLTKTSNSTG